LKVVPGRENETEKEKKIIQLNQIIERRSEKNCTSTMQKKTNLAQKKEKESKDNMNITIPHH